MSEKTAITKEMREELRKPFPKEAYSQHPTKTFLTTLKAMYVTERLNDVFGIGRWSIEHEVIERTADYVLIQGSFISLDYTVIAPSQYGGHKTAGTNTETADGYKSAITDCISKIASYLEIGIEMFKGKINTPKTNNNKNVDDGKKWLNNPSKEWTNVEVGVDKGTITNMSQISAVYKISKEVKAKLELLIK
jgi:hypothetical protein